MKAKDKFLIQRNQYLQNLENQQNIVEKSTKQKMYSRLLKRQSELEENPLALAKNTKNQIEEEIQTINSQIELNKCQIQEILNLRKEIEKIDKKVNEEKMQFERNITNLEKMKNQTVLQFMMNGMMDKKKI